LSGKKNSTSKSAMENRHLVVISVFLILLNTFLDIDRNKSWLFVYFIGVEGEGA
jgi:hypothetical protein